MTLRALRATAHPAGSRIDLSWEGLAGSSTIAVLRCESTYPTLQDLDSSARIATLSGATSYSDTGLKAETVYYYGLVELLLNEAGAALSLTSAMATGSYDSALHAYRQLPAIYRRADILEAPNVDPRLAPEERLKGPLRRFLEVFGGQLDLLRSYTAAARSFSDVQQLDGALLPLLAQWMGWKTDLASSLAQQRNAIRAAPDLFRTAGTAANLRAVVSRFSTWDVRIKEFAQSIAFTNQPEGLAVYELSSSGTPAQASRHVSEDYAFDGRLCLASEEDGAVWLLYHAWTTVGSHSEGPTGLGGGAGLQRCELFAKRRCQGDWLPSRGLVPNRRTDQRHPCAVARRDGGLQLFWAATMMEPGRPRPRIAQCALAFGRDAAPARVCGAPLSSISIHADDFLSVAVNGVAHNVLFLSDSPLVSQASIAMARVAAALDQELPGLVVGTATDGALSLVTDATGDRASIYVSPSSLAERLGLITESTVFGATAIPARLTGEATSRALPAGLFRIYVDEQPEIAVRFNDAPSADQVSLALNAVVPGLASISAGTLVLTSPSVGNDSRLRIEIDADNTLATALGFGATWESEASSAVAAEESALGVTEPAAARDAQDRIWLFYKAQHARQSEIWYRIYEAGRWSAAAKLSEGPARESSVIFEPRKDELSVFWSRWNGSSWELQSAVLENVGAVTLERPEWRFSKPFSGTQTQHSRREPKPYATEAGTVELLFSSDAVEGWQVWRCVIGADGKAENTQRLTAGQYTHRGAAGLVDGAQALLVCRANTTKMHASKLYPGLKTFDMRHSGTTTVDTRNHSRTRSLKTVEDLTHYTCDTRSPAAGAAVREGDPNTIWYARNVIGIYLVPDSQDQRLIVRRREILESVLRDFLPIQVRPVFIVDPAPVRESVYAYDEPNATEPRYIGESIEDALQVSSREAAPLPRERCFTSAPGWVLVHSWSEQYRGHLTVDVLSTPTKLNYRTWREELVEVET